MPRRIIVGTALTVLGAVLSAAGFGMLNVIEFGPGGYVCPAHSCTFGDVLGAGGGGFLILAYGGLLAMVTGIVVVGTLLVRKPRTQL